MPWDRGVGGGRQAKRSRRGTVQLVSYTGGGIGAGPARGAGDHSPSATPRRGGPVTAECFGDQEHEGAAALLLPTLSPILPRSVCDGATPPP